VTPLPEAVAIRAAKYVMRWKGYLPAIYWYVHPDGRELRAHIHKGETQQAALDFHRKQALELLERFARTNRLPRKLPEHIAYATVLAAKLEQPRPFDLSPYIKEVSHEAV
jgi:hypothetical protein